MHLPWRSLGLLAGFLIIGPVRPGVLGAQEPVTITGRVTNDAGAPLSLASVYIETLGLGTQTAADGRYQLTVPAARVRGQQVSLGVRAIGFRNTSALITLTGGALTQDFTLAANPLRLGEVVVTGSGTSTTVEKLGNSINSVKSEDVQKSNEPNIVNALAAKAPGVEITSQSGDPGAGSSIIIRGLKTIQGDGQPLFVIDGQPIDNSTLNTSEFPDASTAYTNRAADINPNDIESIEILKGAAASAIYGARAAQGVVLITTKSGRAGQTRYSFRTSSTWDDVNKAIPLQRQFGQGQFGSALLAACSEPGCYPTSSSWGPQLNGAQTFDHWDEAFSTGHTFDNVLSISGGDDRRTFFASVGNTYQNGTIVGNNDKYSRTSARLKATQLFGSKLRVGGNVAYMDVRARYIQKGNNLNGILLGLARTPPDFNNFPYLVDGLHRSYRYPNPANTTDDRVYDNPFWVINEDRNTSDVNRAIGNFDISWDALNWLNLKYTLGADYSSDQRIEGLPPQSSGDALTGQLWQGTYDNLQLDHNLVARAEKKWSDALNTTLTLGQNLNSRDLRQVQAKGTTYIDPKLFTLNNTVSSNLQPQNYSSLVRVAGYFAQAGVDLWDQLYLTAAVRADQSSTFPKADRTNYYPKASLAWNAFGAGSRGAIGPISYLKPRAAYGAVGREPIAYQILDAFSGGAQGLDFGGGTTSPTQNGLGGLVSDTVKGAPTLKPERTTEFEAGFDFGLFNQRIDGGFTFYDSKTTDVIFYLPVPVSTGYKNVTSNGGEITNKGIEVSLNARALELDRFRWEIGVNWATNQNKLTELNGAEYVGLTGGFGNSVAVKGEPLGTIYGTDWVRCRYGVADADNVQSTSLGESTDINALCRAANAPNGALFVDENGFPLLDPANRVLGDPNPDWISGIRNNFTLFKKFQLSTLVDVKKGGVNWNGTRLALQRFGTSGYTATRATCAQMASNGSSCTRWEGNEQTFGRTIEKSPGVVGPGADTPVPVGENWWREGLGNNFNGPSGQGIEDAGYVKLREISAAYVWENTRVRNLTGFTSIEFRLAARNLKTWSDYKGVDPETNLEGSFGIGRGQDYFNNPQTRSFIFTINLSH